MSIQTWSVMLLALRSKGCDIAQQNIYGCTVLHEAALRGNTVAVSALLALPSTLLTMVTKNGDTPLHYAARGGSVGTAFLLLVAGLDKQIKNRQGLTAVDVARGCGNSDCLFLLQAYRPGDEIKLSVEDKGVTQTLVIHQQEHTASTPTKALSASTGGSGSVQDRAPNGVVSHTGPPTSLPDLFETVERKNIRTHRRTSSAKKQPGSERPPQALPQTPPPVVTPQAPSSSSASSSTPSWVLGDVVDFTKTLQIDPDAGLTPEEVSYRFLFNISTSQFIFETDCYFQDGKSSLSGSILVWQNFICWKGDCGFLIKLSMSQIASLQVCLTSFPLHPLLPFCSASQRSLK